MPKIIQLPTDRDDHLDPDTLAAFAEKALPEREVAAVFAHLAECEHCREGLRIQVRLGDWDGRERPAPPRTSTWFTAPSLRTAAGFLCAVLSVAVMVLWSYDPQKYFAPWPQRTDALQEKSRPVQRESLAAYGQKASQRKGPPGAKPTPRGKTNVAPLGSSDTQSPLPVAGLRRPGRGRVPSGKAHSSDLVTKQKQTELASWHLAKQSQTLGTLWRTVRFRTFASSFAFRSEPARSSLPGPFATARLDHQMSFGTASLDAPDGDQEESPALSVHPIAVKTALGERHFYWNAFGNGSMVAQ